MHFISFTFPHGHVLEQQDVLVWLEKPVLNWRSFLAGVSQKMDGARVERIEDVFEKADGYYYKCIDRMQRIWNCAKQPSKDLSLTEIQALSNCAEHFLFLLRQQQEHMRRLFLAESEISSTLDSIPSSSEAPQDTLDLVPPLPTQSTVQHWMDEQWGMFMK